MKGRVILIAAMLTCAGCTNLRVHDALGTMKNPQSVFSSLDKKPNPFVENNYNILKDAHRTDINKDVLPDNMKRYLAAGFALSDHYCIHFFKDADESQRRRKFGRAAFNDAGTAISTILGLANAGENLVTGVAAGFGLGDSLWRNYDEAFVVNPDLANVQQLVFAAQDNWRERSLGENVKVPKNYSTAQSVILRYANYCSNLGMKDLLNASSAKQKEDLKDNTQKLRDGKPVTKDPGGTEGGSPPKEATGTRPEAASPSLTPG